MLKVVHDENESNEASGSLLDEIVRDGARQMLAAALQAEVGAYVDAHADQVDEAIRRLNDRDPILARELRRHPDEARWLRDRIDSLIARI